MEKAKETSKKSIARDDGDLEFENAELEEKIEELEKKVKDQNLQLVLAKAGKIVVENLEDRSNFANLISN